MNRHRACMSNLCVYRSEEVLASPDQSHRGRARWGTQPRRWQERGQRQQQRPRCQRGGRGATRRRPASACTTPAQHASIVSSARTPCLALCVIMVDAAGIDKRHRHVAAIFSCETASLDPGPRAECEYESQQLNRKFSAAGASLRHR